MNHETRAKLLAMVSAALGGAALEGCASNPPAMAQPPTSASAQPATGQAGSCSAAMAQSGNCGANMGRALSLIHISEPTRPY